MGGGVPGIRGGMCRELGGAEGVKNRFFPILGAILAKRALTKRAWGGVCRFCAGKCPFFRRKRGVRRGREGKRPNRA